MGWRKLCSAVGIDTDVKKVCVVREGEVAYLKMEGMGKVRLDTGELVVETVPEFNHVYNDCPMLLDKERVCGWLKEEDVYERVVRVWGVGFDGEWYSVVERVEMDGVIVDEVGGVKWLNGVFDSREVAERVCTERNRNAVANKKYRIECMRADIERMLAAVEETERAVELYQGKVEGE